VCILVPLQRALIILFKGYQKFYGMMAQSYMDKTTTGLKQNRKIDVNCFIQQATYVCAEPHYSNGFKGCIQGTQLIGFR